jgi:hypothetical protein
VSKMPIADLTELQKAQLEDYSESWEWQVQRSLLYNCEPSTAWREEVEVGGGLLECQRHRGPGLRGSGCRVEVRVKMVASCGVSILSRPVVVEEVHASGRGGGPSMQMLQQRG